MKDFIKYTKVDAIETEISIISKKTTKHIVAKAKI